MENIVSVNKIMELKSKGISPLYSIWITQESGIFDINVWNEIDNEREETKEEYNFETLEEAEKALENIIKENNTANFVRLLMNED